MLFVVHDSVFKTKADAIQGSCCRLLQHCCTMKILPCNSTRRSKSVQTFVAQLVARPATKCNKSSSNKIAQQKSCVTSIYGYFFERKRQLLVVHIIQYNTKVTWCTLVTKNCPLAYYRVQYWQYIAESLNEGALAWSQEALKCRLWTWMLLFTPMFMAYDHGRQKTLGPELIPVYRQSAHIYSSYL